MLQSVKVSVGGQEFDVPQLTLGKLEKIWPLLEEMNNMPAPTSYTDATTQEQKMQYQQARLGLILEVFSVAMKRSVEDLKDAMTFPESNVLIGKFSELLAISGLTKSEEKDESPLGQGDGSQG